ncbi:hypothetical protein [Pseudoxanthomonas indica]|uniref:hypothetical protein n=1 Tax=Pseudoxanthomonas indica TaxID=428993 RepID=UPI0009A84B76|nr:hypothetical protein [Pseudoxanthomonas indica]
MSDGDGGGFGRRHPLPPSTRWTTTLSTVLLLALAVSTAAQPVAQAAAHPAPGNEKAVRVSAMPARAKACQWLPGQAHAGARVLFRGKPVALDNHHAFRIFVPCHAKDFIQVHVTRSNGSTIVHRVMIDPV